MSPGRRLQEGQRSRIRVWDRASASLRTVHESTDRLFEAPNWAPDQHLIVNADGLLWRLPVDGATPPEPIHAEGLPDVNNDHVLTPDGETVFASADDGNLWRVPVAGGAAHRITTTDGRALHFLHGIRPDGQRLAYVRLEPAGGDLWASATIHTIGADGQDDVAVTTDKGPADGCEWTPDQEWILFNTEQFSSTPGHAQLARVRPDGTELEQLTFDERVNWFPHIDPGGQLVVYLSYPPGTTGHPADLPVELRLLSVDDWQSPRSLVACNGGQGTINVPSWSPDGAGFAFVDYPLTADGAIS